MTDTNMTDTNTRHDNRWWCATGLCAIGRMVGKHVRVKQHEENIVNRKSAWARVCGFVCAAAVGGVWFRGLLCSVWRNTSVVVLGVLVVIVAGSRPVVLFEPGC